MILYQTFTLPLVVLAGCLFLPPNNLLSSNLFQRRAQRTNGGVPQLNKRTLLVLFCEKDFSRHNSRHRAEERGLHVCVTATIPSALDCFSGIGYLVPSFGRASAFSVVVLVPTCAWFFILIFLWLPRRTKKTRPRSVQI